MEKEDVSKSSMRKVYAAIVIQKAWNLYRGRIATMANSNGLHETAIRLTQLKYPKNVHRIAVEFISLVQLSTAISKYRLYTDLINSNNFYETVCLENLKKNYQLENIQVHIKQIDKTIQEIYWLLAEKPNRKPSKCQQKPRSSWRVFYQRKYSKQRNC